MKKYVSEAEETLIGKLLDRNTENNHYRILRATRVLILLIISVVLVMKWMGVTTPVVTYGVLVRITVVSLCMLLVLQLLVKRYGAYEWSKWIVLTGVLLIFMVLRSGSSDAPETHAVFYLPIVMGLFYFDVPLIIYITILCSIGDQFLIYLYPQLQPPGGLNALIVRYLCYLWAGIAAIIGSQATRQLLELGTRLKNTNEILTGDIAEKIRLDNLKKEFIAAVSHDLQTPVSLITGYAEGLKDSVVRGEEREEFVDIIIDEARKMGLLVNNMLDFSQLESGYLHLHQENFQIDELLKHNLRQFSNPIREKHIKSDFISLTDGMMVYADPYRIDLVISNFLNNALRHTPEGGTITITLLPRSGEIAIEIENTGDPIPEESLNQIWDPFYRVEQSRSRKYGGTGLGLSIASAILNLHNSVFGAENTPTGVKFFFILPLAGSEEDRF